MPALTRLLVLLCALAPTGSAVTTADLRAHLERELARDRVPAASVAILRNGRAEFLNVGRDAQGHAVTEQTPYLLGSMSKSFTAVAVMQLVDAGRVQLDAPVQRYLPDFRVADARASRDITVRQLLHHTSGLPAQVSATRHATSLADHLRLIRDVTVMAPPGHEHRYSSVGYQVLGVLVERVTGRPFADVVHEKILLPLGMTDWTGTGAALPAGIAGGHTYWFGVPRPSRRPPEPDRMPTAALIADASGLSRYLSFLMEEGGGPVLSASAKRQLLAPGVQADDFAYAMGWRVSIWDDLTVLHHGGVLPDYRGKMVFIPERGVGVVVLTNAATALPLPVTGASHRLADGIARSLVGAPLPSTTLGLSLLYWPVTLGALLVLVSDLRRVAIAWRRLHHAPSPASPAAWRGLGVDALSVVVLLLLPTWAFRVPWAEVLRSAPDVGWWLVGLIALTVVRITLDGARLVKERRA